MHRSIFIYFCLGAVALSVNCAYNVDILMEDIINKTDKMLVKFERDLDRTVPFKELRASLKALDLMARDYHGASQDPIYQATNLGYKATDNYYQATDEIFSWCVKAEVIIGYILENDADIKPAYKVLLKLTEKGVTAINKSLDKLNEVRNDLTEMLNKLRPVPSELNKELQELREQQLTTGRTLLGTLKFIIGVMAKIIISFLKGPIGIALGIASRLKVAGVPIDVIEGVALPDEDVKWKITEAYYKSLIEAVNHAQGNVTAVKESLHKEITHVETLRGDIEGRLEILKYFEYSKSFRSMLRNFKNTLDDYIGRHGVSGSTNFRRRREALSGFDGLDVDAVSYAVDTFLHGTMEEREDAFWRLPDQPVIENHFISHLKISVVK